MRSAAAPSSPAALACLGRAAGMIPAELRERQQWVGWRLVITAGREKPTKQPLNPRGEGLASTTDPATWGTFGQALDCAGANGVGFVFTTSDGYVGIDLDHCRDAESGAVEPWALRIVERVNSYAEISPSGTGVHVIVKGALPPGRRKLANVEMYSEGRFFTFTGQLLPGAPTTIATRLDELAALHAETFGPQPALPAPKPPPAALLSDEEVIRHASAAANSQKFRALWSGDTTGYASQSEAELALCAILAYWTGGDAAAIDRLFRRCGLFRAKWDERRGARTYGEMTIAKARQNVGAASPGVARPSSREGFALTDYGNAERLVARHGHDLRYLAASRQWLCWDGVRWRVDDTGTVMRRAKDTVRSIYSEVAAEEDEVRRRAVAKWATQSESQTRLDAMIVLAQSEPIIGVVADELDADPWLLNVQSGTLHLRSGVLGPHRREDPFAPFLSECCFLSPEAWTTSAELRSEYERFGRERGEDTITGRAFSGRLTAHGPRASVRGHGNVRGWSGVGLRTGRDEVGASAASAASGTIGNFPSRAGIEPKLPDQVLASDRTPEFESETASGSDRIGAESGPAPTCDDGCGAPVEHVGELCGACVPPGSRGDGADR